MEYESLIQTCFEYDLSMLENLIQVRILHYFASMQHGSSELKGNIIKHNHSMVENWYRDFGLA